jgi:hypothetical protein
MVRGGRGGKAVLTRYEVGDGEDGERPPHGARLGLLDQIVHALHPLPHLRLRGGGAARGRRGRRGRAWSGGGLPPRDSPSTEKKAGPGVAARRPRRRFLISEFFFLSSFGFSVTCPSGTSLSRLAWSVRRRKETGSCGAERNRCPCHVTYWRMGPPCQ